MISNKTEIMINYYSEYKNCSRDEAIEALVGQAVKSDLDFQAFISLKFSKMQGKK